MSRMIIKKYVANDLKKAMERMREELGPDAVVLTKRPIQSSGLFGWFSSQKVELTAAIEPEQLKAFRQPGSQERKAPTRAKSVLQANLEELKAALPAQMAEAPAEAAAAGHTYGDPRFAKRSRPAPTPVREAAPETLREPKNDLDQAAAGLISKFREAAKSTEDAAPRRRPEPKIRQEATPTAEQLRKVIREEMTRAQKSVSVGSMENNDENIVGSVRFLMSKGITRGIALDIEEVLRRKVGEVDLTRRSDKRSEWLNAMHREIAKRIKTAGPIELARGRATAVALVGPTGVGKTTTLAKLAGIYSKQLSKKVALISLDTVKVGAREQIALLAEKFELPLQVVTSQAQLTQALDQFADRDLILIDTAGCNQYHVEEVQELSEILSVVPGLRVLLTASACTKDIDVIGTIQNFAPLSIDSLIMTKLDETIAHGVMVNVCEKTGLPISYLADGQRLTGNLRIADASVISKGILLEHNGAEERSLRRMVGA